MVAGSSPMLGMASVACVRMRRRSHHERPWHVKTSAQESRKGPLCREDYINKECWGMVMKHDPQRRDSDHQRLVAPGHQ